MTEKNRKASKSYTKTDDRVSTSQAVSDKEINQMRNSAKLSIDSCNRGMDEIVKKLTKDTYLNDLFKAWETAIKNGGLWWIVFIVSGVALLYIGQRFKRNLENIIKKSKELKKSEKQLPKSED